MSSAETTPDLRARRIATIPNFLSFFRLVTVPVFVWLFVTGREEAGLAIGAAGAWTDFFDGYIARRTGSITELGKLLDPLADRLFIVALAIALLVEDVLPVSLAIAVLARDGLVIVLWPVLERRGLARIPVNFAGKCATAALLFGLGWLAWSHTTWPLQNIGEELGFSGTIVGAVLYWIAGALYVREILRRTADAEFDSPQRGKEPPA